MDKYLLVLLGGAVGSLARYAAGTAIMNRYYGRLSLGTLIVNVSGCFLIGVIMTLLTGKDAQHSNWRLLLVVGFLGGFTTFSSFAYESYLAVRDGNMRIGLMNIVASVVLGYLAVWLGVLSVGKRL
jgi:CrcB protein